MTVKTKSSKKPARTNKPPTPERIGYVLRHNDGSFDTTPSCVGENDEIQVVSLFSTRAEAGASAWDDKLADDTYEILPVGLLEPEAAPTVPAMRLVKPGFEVVAWRNGQGWAAEVLKTNEIGVMVKVIDDGEYKGETWTCAWSEIQTGKFTATGEPMFVKPTAPATSKGGKAAAR